MSQGSGWPCSSSTALALTGLSCPAFTNWQSAYAKLGHLSKARKCRPKANPGACSLGMRPHLRLLPRWMEGTPATCPRPAAPWPLRSKQCCALALVHALPVASKSRAQRGGVAAHIGGTPHVQRPYVWGRAELGHLSASTHLDRTMKRVMLSFTSCTPSAITVSP